MKNVYLDTNGDILNEIFNLENENCIDNILQSIINGNSGKTRKNVIPMEEKKKDKKDSKKKETKKKEKKSKENKIRKITIRKIK